MFVATVFLPRDDHGRRAGLFLDPGRRGAQLCIDAP